MLSDYFSEINDHGTVVPVKDLAAFPRSEQAVLGAKNLLPVNVSSKTEAGVTYTVNDDNTITTTNNASSTTFLNIPIPSTLNGKTLKLSGCPEGGEYGKYRLIVILNNALTDYIDDGQGAEFTIPQNSSNNFVRLLIYTGYGDGLLFKPMLTLPTDNESDYEHFVPYAMTNRELTEKAEHRDMFLQSGSGITGLNNAVTKLFELVIPYLDSNGKTADGHFLWTGNKNLSFCITRYGSTDYQGLLIDSLASKLYVVAYNNGTVTVAEFTGTTVS